MRVATFCTGYYFPAAALTKTCKLGPKWPVRDSTVSCRGRYSIICNVPFANCRGQYKTMPCDRLAGIGLRWFIKITIYLAILTNDKCRVGTSEGQPLSLTLLVERHPSLSGVAGLFMIMFLKSAWILEIYLSFTVSILTRGTSPKQLVYLRHTSFTGFPSWAKA